MEKSFLEQVHLGQTEWYRYFFGIKQACSLASIR